MDKLYQQQREIERKYRSNLKDQREKTEEKDIHWQPWLIVKDRRLRRLLKDAAENNGMMAGVEEPPMDEADLVDEWECLKSY